ncbi:actin interacting protein 3-domain-containing protein [Tricharina praecox]|uniref:actin interacting protein 3-domain-containing protein n=1 Tax=Tricharina praecox TaxID=43433 RepID=UPI00221FE6B2|nr:actin interacting protein 3-domain-containing protein [Tricharina praecox]KAI5845445.1 actin interacting protein 3-domain-containing protein [Tricharina praecox]
MSAASRNSSGSASRSPRHRNQVNLSTIEKSVTHLLVATKQLLETLTAWSRQQATEAEVSDVYVRLGSEFNIACRAFTAIGVETADLGNVPDSLRSILENTLSQDASPQSLDVYLPRIREIIINLLHGLKRKQQKLRQKQSREIGEGSSGGATRGSSSSLASSARTSGGGGGDASGSSAEQQEMTPPRTSSLPGGNTQRNSPLTQPAMPPSGSVRGSMSTTGSRSSHQHSTSVSSSQGSTVGPPPPAQDNTPPYPTSDNPPQIAEPEPPSPVYTILPPPPTPPTQDALAALQQHSSLERRASRRYEAYQIAKLSGKSASDVPVLPTRDPSVIPRNRESMDAVQKRHSGRARSIRSKKDQSPATNPRRISEEKDFEAAPSPVAQTPDESVGPAFARKPERPDIQIDTNVNSPVAVYPSSATGDSVMNGMAAVASPEQRSNTPSETTLFLQLGRSIKKVALPDNLDELSLTSLRLLFISKFNYNPPSGDDFPEIYLQDPVSGVRYELEDLQDVKDRSVLCLNVEVLDEVKRHIDDGLEGLKKIVVNLAGSVEQQGLQMTRVAERQEEAAKKIAELSVAPPIVVPPPAPTPAAATAASKSPAAAANNVLSPGDAATKLNEVRDIRRDLAVLRQVFSTFVADMNTSMNTVKTKATAVKQVAAKAVTSGNEGRVYVEKGKAVLGGDADNLVTRVDDLQDTVEDLRKDVVLRGVRPLPRQLEAVSKELAMAKAELKKMADYIKREKPLFRRVWERELEVVCEEQEFFSMQENLINDLEDDLEKASQTFVLVEQCSEQQLKANAAGARNAGPRGFPGVLDDPLNPTEAKVSVLSEVRALQPNHESRLEAIERAEKARQKELEGRVPAFQKELGAFVEENKLRKTGGVEEAERLRIAREEQARKDIWELKQKMDAAESEEEESDDEEDDDDEESDSESEAATEVAAAETVPEAVAEDAGKEKEKVNGHT